MNTNFPQSLAWVLISEGGNDDDPDDSGGRTHNGITQREYDAYCKMAGLPHGDVWKCPDPVRDDIYHKSYWFPYCDNLPPGVDYVFFDEAVNAGMHEAVLILQRALGVADDGHIGVVTSAALSEMAPNKLIDAMAAESVKVYKAIERAHPVDVKSDRGWMIRVAERTKRAHSLVT